MARLAITNRLASDLAASDGVKYSDSIFHFVMKSFINAGRRANEKIKEVGKGCFAQSISAVLNRIHPLEATFIKKIQYGAFSQVRFIQQEQPAQALKTSYSNAKRVPTKYVEIVGLAGIIDWQICGCSPDQKITISGSLENLLEALEPDEYHLLDVSEDQNSRAVLLELAQFGKQVKHLG